MPALSLENNTVTPSNTRTHAVLTSSSLNVLLNITTITPIPTPSPSINTTSLLDSIVTPTSLSFPQNTTQPARHGPEDINNVSTYVFEAIGLLVAIMALVVGILQLRIEYRKRQQRYARINDGSVAGV
jgi:hypothetical protein